MFMLDTDTCSYIIKQHPSSVLERFERAHERDVCISVITEAELLYGLARYPDKIKFRRHVHDFIKGVSIFNWDSAAAEEYAIVRAQLTKSCKNIASMDLLIAAHALSIGATIVSNNVRHFSMVPKLKTVNWI